MGTDSHTTMINGLGVLGWGVGGIEAEAVMLGQAISMLLPEVVGYKLYGTLGQYVTSTDLVLTITKVFFVDIFSIFMWWYNYIIALKVIGGSGKVCRVLRTRSFCIVDSW